MPAPDNRASLGCGTLILIALIVMIFSNSDRSGSRRLERQLEELRAEINHLKADMGSQSATLAQIKQSLDEINKRPAPRPRVVPARPPATPELDIPPPVPEN